MLNDLDRIHFLASLATRDTLYDMCCDHGEIGLCFLNNNSNKKVIFNDQVESITQALKSKLSKFTSEQVQLECQDARMVNFDANSSVILAGVGGNLITQVLERNKERIDIEWILSPHKNYIEMISFLRDRIIEFSQLTIESQYFRVYKNILYPFVKISSKPSEIKAINYFPEGEIKRLANDAPEVLKKLKDSFELKLKFEKDQKVSEIYSQALKEISLPLA